MTEENVLSGYTCFKWIYPIIGSKHASADLNWASFSKKATIWSLLHPSISFLDAPGGDAAAKKWRF